jgi:3-hydroxyisobutyrate dehydrogenase
MATIAFLGLGVMGERMAFNLVKAGHQVTVYNRTVAKAEALVAAGAQRAESPREAAQGAEVIFSMVANDGASQAVWLGENGALAGAAEGTMVIECSTLSPTWVAQLATLAAERALTFVDAPVMGSTDAAAGATLKLLVGGKAETVETLRPLFLTVGDTFFHCGATGAGAKMKLVYNALLAVQMAAFGEVVALAEKAGLDVALATQVLGTGSTGSPLIQRSGATLVSREYGNPGFQLQHMRKDVTYALQLAQSVGAALPIVATTRELYQLAGMLGYDTAGMAAVNEVVRGQAKSV